MKHLPSLKAEIKALAAAAKRDGVLLQSFKSLRLNMGLPDTVSGVLLEADVWESIEGEAEREGEYVLGLDLGGSTAQSAAAAWWPKTGRLEGFAVFPTSPDLATRATNDGAGSLYSECHRRGELLLAGDMVSDVAELLSEALSRWGKPAAIAADRFKKAELIGHLNALAFPTAALVLRGMGYRDGSEDVPRISVSGPTGPCNAGQELVAQGIHGGGAACGRRCGQLEAGERLRRGRRRSRAKDDIVAAAILAVAVGRRGSGVSTAPAYALAG